LLQKERPDVPKSKGEWRARVLNSLKSLVIEYPNQIQAMAAIAQLITAVILAIITFGYVRLTKKLVNVPYRALVEIYPCEVDREMIFKVVNHGPGYIKSFVIEVSVSKYADIPRNNKKITITADSKNVIDYTVKMGKNDYEGKKHGSVTKDDVYRAMWTTMAGEKEERYFRVNSGTGGCYLEKSAKFEFKAIRWLNDCKYKIRN
jgi:hypothetical protein